MSLLTIVTLSICIAVICAGIVAFLVNPKLFVLMIKNLRRNILRTFLTALAIFVLVIMITMIWTVVTFLDDQMAEQSQDIKLIITERWQLPSQMPMTHAKLLDPDGPELLPELKPYVSHGDFMTWSFYGGSTDGERITRENLVFMFAMNPEHIKSMMEDLQDLPDEVIANLKADPRNVLLGRERLVMLNKKVGESFKLTSLNYKGIDLEFRIVGDLPGTRYNLMGIMNGDYFRKSFDTYYAQKKEHHPLEPRQLNLVWLRVRDKDAVAKVASIIEGSSMFADRPVKCETASSGIAAFLDAYRDVLWSMKWLVVPISLVSMMLVIANAIAITVSERRTEMAVLKVLGFKPVQIQVLVMGEAIIVGGLSGFAATLGTLAVINWTFGGISMPIAFFPAFMVPNSCLAWGFAIGAGTGVLGSIVPAWTARTVKVSEVFAKVA